MKRHTLFGKKLIKFVAMLLCAIMTLGAVACGGGREDLDENMVQISLVGSTDGYGLRAYQLQADRFNEAFKNKTYTGPDGRVYTGANMEIVGVNTPPSPGKSWAEDTYTIYCTTTEYAKVSSSYKEGYIANINDILTTEIEADGESIADKMSSESKYYYGDETTGELYGLSYAQTISGIMYDRDLFDKGYYIGTSGGTTYTSKIFPNNLGFSNVIRLVGKNGAKSVGPNGIAGDYDDGLPSSFVEFVILCEKFASVGIEPIAYPGQYPSYLALGLAAIYYSLLGYENAKSMISFESEGLNVITGFTNDALFKETYNGVGTTIKTPKVAQGIPMEESSGYYHTWTLERYLAIALGQLVVKSATWESYSTKMNRSHRETHLDFIFGLEEETKRAAMMVEGSYWYNEAVEATAFLQYEAQYGKTADERGIAWMSLPVNIYSPVTGENTTATVNGITESLKGEPQTLDDVGRQALLVNANVEDQPHIMEAVEDFFLFAYSNEGINRFAKDAGYAPALRFDYDEEIMADAPKYIQETFKLFADSNVVTMFSDTPSWRNRANYYTFEHNYDSYFFNGEHSDNCAKFIREKGAVEAFKQTMIKSGIGAGEETGSGWWKYYISPNEVDPPTAYVYPEGHPKAGQKVEFK